MSEEEKSSTGLDSNIGGLLSYVLGWITGLIFFLLEKKDEFVRFHAMQSLIVFGAIAVFSIVFGVLFRIPFVGPILGSFFWIGSVVLWIILMVKAYQGERFKLPIAGDLAEKYSGKRFAEDEKVTGTTPIEDDEFSTAMTEDVKCPQCGSETVVKTVTKGPNTGSRFHVCTRYPDCKGKVPISG